MSSAVPGPQDRQPSRTPTPAPVAPVAHPRSNADVVRAQKEQFGGMKFGACFFGWLTATGTAVLLTAIVAAVAAGLGVANGITAADINNRAATIGLAGGIALLVIIFIAYVAGGYVAGRMARFSGAKQGLGVWLWGIVAAIVITVLSLIAGNQYNPANLNGLPRFPAGEVTATSVITALIVLAVALVGAILGGLAGMRFHRRVDRADLEQTT